MSNAVREEYEEDSEPRAKKAKMLNAGSKSIRPNMAMEKAPVGSDKAHGSTVSETGEDCEVRPIVRPSLNLAHYD